MREYSFARGIICKFKLIPESGGRGNGFLRRRKKREETDVPVFCSYLYSLHTKEILYNPFKERRLIF